MNAPREITLQLHPLCTLFPRMEGAEFAALVEDIRANGLRQPIVLHEGMILDGGNRYRACLNTGITPTFIEFDGSNPVSFVLSANLHRRHMTAGQQAAIVASAQDWARQAASGSNQHRASDEGGQACPPSELDTRAKRAAVSGASERTQKMADKVAKEAPELAKQVAHGEKTLPAAVEELTGKRPGKKPQKTTPPLADRSAAADAGPPQPPENVRMRQLKAHVKLLEQSLDTAKRRIAILEEENAGLKEQIEEAGAEIQAMRDELDAYKLADLEPNEQQREYREMQQRVKDAEERARVADILKNEALHKNNELTGKLKGWEKWARKQEQQRLVN